MLMDWKANFMKNTSPVFICLFLLRISGLSFPSLLKPDEVDESYGFLSWFFLRALLYGVGSGLILCLYMAIELLLRAISACILWCQPKYGFVLKSLVPTDYSGLMAKEGC